jgi:hypothetical protein
VKLTGTWWKLYLEYAQPYEMEEIQLLIFHVSDHHDPDMVDALWRKVIEKGTWRFLFLASALGLRLDIWGSLEPASWNPAGGVTKQGRQSGKTVLSIGCSLSSSYV